MKNSIFNNSIIFDKEQQRVIEEVFKYIAPIQTIKKRDINIDFKNGYQEFKIHLHSETSIKVDNKRVKSFRKISSDTKNPDLAEPVILVDFDDGTKQLYALNYELDILPYDALTVLNNSILESGYFSLEKGSPGKHLKIFMENDFPHRTLPACKAIQEKDYTLVAKALDDYHYGALAMKAFIKLFNSLNGETPIRYCPFEDLPVECLSWNKESVRANYTFQDRVFYSFFHENIFKLVSKHKLPITQIISLGGGDGSELERFAKAEWLQPSPSMLLVDINQENTQKAHQIFENNKKFFSLVGDVTQPTTHADITNRIITNSANACVLFIASGLLARQVLQGSYQAVQVLQHIFNNADFVATTSLSAFMFNRRILKAIGYHIKDAISQAIDRPDFKGDHKKPVQNKVRQPVFLIEKQSAAERLSFIDKQSEKRSNKNVNIDLTMSATPLKDLESLRDSKDKGHQNRYQACKQLDLSWVHLSESDFKNLVDMHLIKMRQLKIIVVSGHEPWIAKLKDKSFKTALPGRSVYRRHDHANQPNEVAFFSRRTLTCFKDQMSSKDAEAMLKYDPF